LNFPRRARDFYNRVRQFMKDEIEPVEPEYLRELRSLDNPWVVLPVIEELKAKAKSQGCGTCSCRRVSWARA